MDVKIVFLNGILNEKVYFKQPNGFEDLHCPYYVYKLNNALYGLKLQGHGIKYLDKYFDWKRLQKKRSGENSIHQKLQISVRVCARHQTNPKKSHIVVVKRIIKYINGNTNYDTWFSKDILFLQVIVMLTRQEMLMIEKTLLASVFTLETIWFLGTTKSKTLSLFLL